MPVIRTFSAYFREKSRPVCFQFEQDMVQAIKSEYSSQVLVLQKFCLMKQGSQPAATIPLCALCNSPLHLFNCQRSLKKMEDKIHNKSLTFMYFLIRIDQWNSSLIQLCPMIYTQYGPIPNGLIQKKFSPYQVLSVRLKFILHCKCL